MSSWEERMQAERGCQLELQKQKISGTAEFRKWAVRNHPDKGGKLRVFQKVSGCVDLMYKTPEADSSGPSTSYSQPSSRPPGKRTKPRAAKPSQSDYFWSAYEEYETDEDFTFTRFSRGAQYRPRDARRRESERTYGFRGTSPMDDNVTFEDWEDFEAFIREHVRKREWEARRAEETEKVRKEQKRKEREREREKERQEREARPRGGREARTEKEAKAKRATSPDEWRGPANPYQAPEASMQSRTRHPPRDRGEETPREKGRAAAQEVLQRLKRAFRFEGATGHRKEGELSWRHRLSRPQPVLPRGVDGNF